MTDLLDLIGSQLGPDAVSQLSRRIGADPGATSKGIETALPLLLGGLARNASRPQGASALAQALERDHAPDLVDNLGALLGGGGRGGGGLGALLGAASEMFGGGSAAASQPKALDGAGILGHILGSKRAPVETGVSRASGLDKGQVAKLLMMLAPLVMSALAKSKQQSNLDSGGLADLLGRQRAEVEQRTPQMKGGGLLDLLDRDNDGSIADDIASLGASIGGRLLRG
ncbi:MAG TPA: DUF937 domain-containing protein [Thermoanaerobaculia bacterium]|nr:DUF937 domain-containing protein [Thermoanaerobaculia bacterium]